VHPVDDLHRLPMHDDGRGVVIELGKAPDVLGVLAINPRRVRRQQRCDRHGDR
jgi:hypothetical protein